MDIPELVCGKVCGTPPLNHTGMIKLRSVGQYTGIRYAYRGDGVWRMASAQKKEVRNVLFACAQSIGKVVPTTNDKEEHKEEAFA